MKTVKIHQSIFGRLLWVVLAAALVRPAAAKLEETFDMLQIGTKIYRNVTVTTKSSSYIFIMHAEGMTNLKVAELPAELRLKLGYADTQDQSSKKHAQGLASAFSTKRLPSVKMEQLQQMGQNCSAQAQAAWGNLQANPRARAFAAGVGLLVYLFFCCCCRIICLKTNTDPGLIVWLPLLQLIPLTRAARMAPVWFLAWLVPGLNVIAQIVWSVKISEACGKSKWYGLLLLLPLINVFAFLGLVFGGGRAPKEERVVEIMTLEAA